MVRMRTTRKPRKSKSADMFDSARVAATDRYRQHAEISCGNRGGRLWIGRGAFLSEQGGGEQVSVCGDHGYGNRGEAGGRLSTATRACLCADCLEACDLEPTRPSRNAPVPSEHGHATIRGFQNARRRLTLTLTLRPPVPRATCLEQRGSTRSTRSTGNLATHNILSTRSRKPGEYIDRYTGRRYVRGACGA
jgi:hypothetical protein